MSEEMTPPTPHGTMIYYAPDKRQQRDIKLHSISICSTYTRLTNVLLFSLHGNPRYVEHGNRSLAKVPRDADADVQFHCTRYFIPASLLFLQIDIYTDQANRRLRTYQTCFELRKNVYSDTILPILKATPSVP